LIKLLIVDDSALMRRHLVQIFERQDGFNVLAVRNGVEALQALDDFDPDVITLDVNMPDMDGLDVLRAIRASGQYRALPVVLVTARNEEIDRVLGLELGADDYISKPFSTRELVARIRAILRRAAFIDAPDQTRQLLFGPVSIDLDMHTARVEGEALDLTRREFELLAYFLHNPRRVLSREKILQQVWGLEYLGESRTIDAHVRRVRSKLGPAAALIETVVGVGYRMGNVDG